MGRADESPTSETSTTTQSPAAARVAPPRAPATNAPGTGDVLTARHRYRLEQRLGEGGSGSVFKAVCLDTSSSPESPPQIVALKVLGSSSRHPSAGAGLKRELSALLAIRHDRIPKLYDWSLETDPSFAVLEYFPNGSLADAWATIGRFDEEQTWRLISDLASAVHAAHRSGILHLDVKPSNVLLDGRGGFVLTDFGVSHASRMSKGLLHQGQIAVGLGTHGYRAPEQEDVSIQSFDLRTDLWGIGATAWALYTGIDLNKRQEVLRHRTAGNVYGLQRLSDVRLHCPPLLEEVVMDLLYIDPARRPGGAVEVLSQIRAIASGFGLDSQTVAAARRNEADPAEIRQVLDSLVDPLWSSICRGPGFDRYFVKFEDGEMLCGSGEQAHHTILLLSGRVRVEREGELLAMESTQCELMGAVSTLSGAPREVTLRAEGMVWTCIFNEAELEQLVTCNPSLAVRMIRQLAHRIKSGPPRHRG